MTWKPLHPRKFKAFLHQSSQGQVFLHGANWCTCGTIIMRSALSKWKGWKHHHPKWAKYQNNEVQGASWCTAISLQTLIDLYNWFKSLWMIKWSMVYIEEQYDRKPCPIFGYRPSVMLGNTWNNTNLKRWHLKTHLKCKWQFHNCLNTKRSESYMFVT